MTDREFENIIKEKFSAVKCSDVGKKRIFDALKGAENMKNNNAIIEDKREEKIVANVKPAKVKKRGGFIAAAAALAICIGGGAFLYGQGNNIETGSAANSESNTEAKSEGADPQVEPVHTEVYEENYQYLKKVYDDKGYDISTLGSQLTILDKKVGNYDENDNFEVRVAGVIDHNPYATVAFVFIPKNGELDGAENEDLTVNFEPGYTDMPDYYSNPYDMAWSYAYNCGDYAVAFLSCSFLTVADNGTAIDRYVANTNYDVYVSSFHIGQTAYELNYTAMMTLWTDGEYTGISVENGETQWYTCGVDPFKLDIQNVSFNASGLDVTFTSDADIDTLREAIDPSVIILDEETRKKEFDDYDPNKNYDPIKLIMSDGTEKAINFTRFNLKANDDGSYTAYYDTAQFPIDYNNVKNIVLYNLNISPVDNNSSAVDDVSSGDTAIETDVQPYYIYHYYGQSPTEYDNQEPVEITDPETIDLIDQWIDNAMAVYKDYPYIDGLEYGGGNAYEIYKEKWDDNENAEPICIIDITQYGWESADGREVHNFVVANEDGERERYQLPQSMIGDIMGLIAAEE